MPKLPDMSVDTLVQWYGLTTKDAITLLSLDDGDRLEYFMGVMEPLTRETFKQEQDVPVSELGRLTGNW